jgi:hypothetical protein
MLYEHITRPWFAAIEANAQEQSGIAIAGPEGTASHDTPLGLVTVQWVYDANEQTLTVGCTKKPFLVREATIDTALTALVESSKPEA